MWIALFAITFYKVLTSHNSDPRRRHGVWVWLGGVCVIGLADFSVCMGQVQLGRWVSGVCEANFSSYYFLGIFIITVLAWSSLPYIGFLGRDPFNKGYWL